MLRGKNNNDNPGSRVHVTRYSTGILLVSYPGVPEDLVFYPVPNLPGVLYMTLVNTLSIRDHA